MTPNSRPSTIALLACVVIGAPGSLVAQPADAFFDASRLQELHLSINSRDLAQLRLTYLENTFYPADLRSGGVTVRNAAVRSRGNGSRSGIKLGLRVDFDRYVKGQTLLGRRSIILDNLWQDPSMIRERVAMALFARLGLPAPLESLCRLYINNEYAGVYAIVEEIDESFLARTLADGTGYLHEYHWLSNYYLQDLGDDLTVYAPLFEPRTRKHEPPSALLEAIRQLIRAVNEPSQSLWRDAIERHLDLDQLLVFVAVEQFVAERDGLLGYAGVNNLYVHRSAASTRHRLIPWDRDHAFQEVDTSIFAGAAENALVARVLAAPDLQARFLSALDQVAAVAQTDDWLATEVQQAAALARVAAADDPVIPYPVAAREEAMAHLLDFARRRPQIVRDQVTAARAALAGRR